MSNHLLIKHNSGDHSGLLLLLRDWVVENALHPAVPSGVGFRSTAIIA